MFSANFATAQNWNRNLKLSVSVKIIDSEYLMIPHLILLSDSQNIKINQPLTYDNEKNTTADCNIFLQKVIGKSYVNMYVAAFRQPLLLENSAVLKRFKASDSIKDTINLKEYIPLENGEYRVLITLNYYLKGIKYQINSEWYNFNVSFKPKNQLFD